MANVFYLDVDDEITSAAARIRTSQDPRVGLVVPPGSRIATSRINFRLLAREALERNRALSIVSTDPAARALAASAGLPVYATVGEFEADQGAVGGASQAGTSGSAGRPAADNAGLPAGVAGLATGSAIDAVTAGMGARGVPGGVSGGGPDARVGARSGGAVAPTVRVAGRSSRASARLAATVVTVVVIALVFGLIGAFLLPSATITITPRIEAVVPLQLSIRADPNATTADPVAGVVPAVELSKDFTSFGTFHATGKKTTTSAAAGSVTFTSINTVTSVQFPSGSVVSTTDGVAFATTQDLTIPRAKFGHTAPTGSVDVKAVKGGTSGNVAAGSINQLPPGYPSYLYMVTNPAATAGGTATTTLQIQKSDTDAAVANLTKGLKQQFSAWLAAPDALAPGSTAFAKTGVLGTAAADTDPTTLIGVAETTFQLTMTATGTETAVDESTLTSLAVSRIQASVPTQFSLVTGSEKVTIGTPRADGAAVVFPITATASQVRHLDPDTLRQEVKGKSIDEARSILAEDGTVDIQTWPGFVGTIPSLEWRLSLTIDTGGVSGSPGPGSSSAPGVQPSGVPPLSAPPSSAPTGSGSE